MVEAGLSSFAGAFRRVAMIQQSIDNVLRLTQTMGGDVQAFLCNEGALLEIRKFGNILCKQCSKSIKK